MKEEPAIDGFDPERIIPAAKTDTEALRLLLGSDWLDDKLDKVSRIVSWRHDLSVDAQEIRDHLLEKVVFKLDKLTNPEGIPWASCLNAWLYTIAERYPKNVYRHRDVEERHRSDVAHEHTIKLTDGKRKAEPHTDSMLQEAALLHKEQDALVPTIRRTTRAIFYSLETRDAWLVSLWMAGMTFQAISDLTGTARSTVWNVVKSFEKTVVKEIMKSVGEAKKAAQLLSAVNKHSEGIRELLANSLGETELRGDGTRAGV